MSLPHMHLQGQKGLEHITHGLHGQFLLMKINLL
jgi:hypothetical protein